MRRRVPGRLGEAARRVAGAPEWPPVAAGLLGLLALLDLLLRSDGGYLPLLLGLAATVPVALARGYLVAAAVTVATASLLLLAGPAPLPVAAPVALAGLLYLVGRRCAGWLAGLLLVPFAGYAVAGSLLRDQAGDRALAVGLAGLAAVAVGAGAARRTRAQARAREASRRAVADTLLDHAARGERARIARELHDVVAHHISMIAVQAETARLATPGMPAAGADRLRAIGDTARTALAEMRRLLGVLREDADPPAPTREPQPGLAELVELVDQARDSAGGSIRLIVRGRVRRCAPGVELTAYRVVQEALTNARRHAPGAAVDVELWYAGELLHLRVRDNGAGPAGSGSGGNGHGHGHGHGHGLLGMRERVAAAGGELWTGPGPAGGFLVEARLPAPGPAPRPSESAPAPAVEAGR